jgi:hypothetical protein
MSLLAMATGGFFAIRWACQQAPSFYCNALAQDRSTAKQASDALLREAAALVSGLHKNGPWQAMFTAEQINGWLAYDMLQNHPHLLPSTISDLRVAIQPDRAQIAFRWVKPAWSAIVFLETQIYLRDENVVAVRICKARAGLLPLPLGGLLRDLTSAAEEAGLRVDQEQIEGDPVLLISVAGLNGGDKLLNLESLELTAGEIYVAGRTNSELAGGPLARRPEPDRNAATDAHAEKSNVQR